MKNELLHIGNVTIYGYGLMIAIALIAAYISLEIRARRYFMNSELIFGLYLTCAIGGLSGAKLLFWITNLSSFLSDPILFLSSFADGFVVFGGILGGILCGFLYCRKKHLDFLMYFDLAMPSIALAQGFGRIGCFLAGCCYGAETTSKLSVVFHESSFAPNDIPLIPTQIYSSILDFAHFFILCRIARHTDKRGVVASFYLIFYSIGRFILEFFRGDLERGSVGFISTSQFISLFTFAAGIVLLTVSTKNTAKARN